MNPLPEFDAEGARIRGVVNGAGAHAPADPEHDELARLRAALAAAVAERDNQRARAEGLAVAVLQLRDERREALRERDEWAARGAAAEREAARLRGCEATEGDLVCAHEARALDLEARLAAAARASASIPAPAAGPWAEADREAYLLGYVSADDARAAGHPLPAAAGPAANGPPSPPDSTAPAGSGAAPRIVHRGRAVPGPRGTWVLPPESQP